MSQLFSGRPTTALGIGCNCQTVAFCVPMALTCPESYINQPLIRTGVGESTKGGHVGCPLCWGRVRAVVSAMMACPIPLRRRVGKTTCAKWTSTVSEQKAIRPGPHTVAEQVAGQVGEGAPRDVDVTKTSGTSVGFLLLFKFGFPA
jgi:hypothetical protein